MNALKRGLYRTQFEMAVKAGLIAMLVSAAKNNGIRPEVAVALASRETGIRNILGDKKRGVGVVQIDRRYHVIAAEMYADGSWQQEPEKLIEHGMEFLSKGIRQSQHKYPNYNAEKIGLSAYNAGIYGAWRGVDAGNSDRYTTGGNYAQDILERAQFFKTLLTD